MQQPAAILSSSVVKPVGTGGFLNPESITNGFGIREGMKIADFGCGAGYFTILLAQRTGSDGRVYALDVQENALDSVRAKARASGVDNIETIRTNLEIIGNSGLADDSQDMVLLANVLFQSGKKAEIVREAKRVLIKNGMLVIIDWKKGANGLGAPNEKRLSDSEMQKMAEDEGFAFDHPLDAGNFHFGLVFHKP